MARLARRLLAEAEARPDLIRRSEIPSRLTKARRDERIPAMALLSDPTLNTRQYLEDLVRIAISSAEKAADVSSEARTAGRNARRGMALVTCLGALGLMVGLAGFTAGRSANFRLSEIRDEMSALSSTQQRAQERLAEIAARARDQGDSASATLQPSVAPAVATRPLPPPDQVEVAEAAHRPSVPPATVVASPRRPYVGYYMQPWPDSSPPRWRLSSWQ